MYGQYSAGSCRRTKADILDEAFASIPLASSRKAGHNRVHAVGHDGTQYFSLHVTIVATLSADKTVLTLADGGWPTNTTRAAWSDACTAFGLSWVHWGLRPSKHEREVRIRVNGRDAVERIVDEVAEVEHPLIRAGVDDGNFAVRYDGKHLISEAGAKIRATPFKVLTTLYRVAALSQATKGMYAMRGDALYQFSFEAFGFTISPGQSSRFIMIGCHTFKTQEMRAMIKTIEALYPAAVKPAKRFHKLNPLDYGVPAYQAAKRARAIKMGWISAEA